MQKCKYNNNTYLLIISIIIKISYYKQNVFFFLFLLLSLLLQVASKYNIFILGYCLTSFIIIDRGKPNVHQLIFPFHY